MLIMFLSKSDCCVGVLVCRSWSTVFTPHIWKTIKVLDQPTFSASQRFYRLKKCIEANNGVLLQKYGHHVRELDTSYLSIVDTIVRNDPGQTCSHLRKLAVHSRSDPRVPPSHRVKQQTRSPQFPISGSVGEVSSIQPLKSAIAALLRYNQDLRILSLHRQAAQPDKTEDNRPIGPSWMSVLPVSLVSLSLDTPCFEAYQPLISTPSLSSQGSLLSPRVLVNLQKLIIQGPYINGSIRLELLRRCPNLEVLRLYIRENPLDRCSVLADVLYEYCPQLTAARFDGQTCDEELSCLIGASAGGWKSFMLDGTYGSLFGRLSAKVLLAHAATLENVRLEGCTAFTSTDIQQLFCSAPKLKRFHGISIDRLDEKDLTLRADELVQSKWICTSLESFACKVTHVPRPDLTRRTNGRALKGIMHTTGTIEASYQLQGRVYEQLSRLTKLRHLVLGGDIGEYYDKTPEWAEKERGVEGEFFDPKLLQAGYQYQCLSMTLESGMDQLKGLKEMRAVVVEGMAVGLSNPAELDWQKEHWPLLETGQLFRHGYFSDPFWLLFLE
ncbi:hypothetical protein BGX24_001002 [Mortierella sp. AD032]|nr:hypothetical protein BGX24_001002 [Mortierella sp. AD032]